MVAQLGQSQIQMLSLSRLVVWLSVGATTANTRLLDGALTVAGGLGVALDASIGDDLRMISDAVVVSFGANSEITLTHVHDTGLNLKHTATGDDKPIILTYKQVRQILVANDVIGAINFQAPDEASATGDNKLVVVVLKRYLKVILVIQVTQLS